MPEQQENDLKDIFLKLKIGILIFIAALVGAGYMIGKMLVPEVQAFEKLKQDNANAIALLDKTKKDLDDLKIIASKQAEAASEIEKAFYNPAEAGLDREGVIAGEFSEILELIKANTIKTKSINYTYEPSDDPFVAGAKEKFNVAQLDMSMIGTYSNFENFLKDLYKHEHFLNIRKISVTPYEKDKSILLIDFSLKLYAEKAKRD